MQSRPDRPIVVLLDWIVAAFSLGVAVQSTGFVQGYFLAACWLFFWSGLHHFYTTSSVLSKLDRIGILVFIAVTPLPYMDSISQTVFFWAWIACLGSVILCSALIVFDQADEKGWGYAFRHLLPGFFGATSLLGAALPSLMAYIILWSGVLLYWLQGQINVHEWPNRRAYALVQHGVLYVAFGLHAAAVLLFL